MKPTKWEIKAGFTKWGLHFHIFRFRGLDNPQTAKIDVLFFIALGYGRVASLFKSIYFRIDALDMNTDEGKELLGFTLPIGKAFK